MSTAQSSAHGARREDFPVEVFRYLEAKLQEIRRQAMKHAAEIADRESAEDAGAEEVYRVEKQHVDRALAELIEDPQRCKELLGLPDRR